MKPAAESRFFSESIAGRKGEILDAAVAVFSEKGYDAGSMREIAERVGVTEPALYRHFASKEDLFLALVGATGRRITSEVAPILDAAVPERIAETIETVFTNRARAARMYLPVVQTVMVSSMHNATFREAYQEALVRPMRERLERLVPQVDAHFGVETGDVSMRARTLISVFVGHFITSFVFEDESMPLSEAVMRVMGWRR